MQPKVYRMYLVNIVLFIGRRCGMTTGEKIRLIREEANLNQEQFAELLSITRQSVSKWESNKNFPETSKLIIICDHFNTSIEYLLRDDNLSFENQSKTIEIEDIIKYHNLLVKKQQKRLNITMIRLSLILFLVQLVHIFINMISFREILPKELHLLYLDWDTYSFPRGNVFNLFIIPLIMILVFKLLMYFNNRYKNQDFNQLLSLVEDSGINTAENYKKKAYFLMILINLVFVARLLLSDLGVKVLTRIFDGFAIPGYFLGNTLFPSRGVMIEQIFSINYLIVFLFLMLMIILTYSFVNLVHLNENKKILFVLIPVTATIFIVMVYLNTLFSLLLSLVIIGNLFILRLILNYYQNKPLFRLSIIYFIYVTVISVIRLLIEHYSFGALIQSSSGVVSLVLTSDYVVAQSAANVLLISIVTDNFIGIDGVIILGIIIYGIIKLIDRFKKNKVNAKFINVSFVWFFISTIIISIITIGGLMYVSINYLILNSNLTYEDQPDTSIKSNQCFTKEYLTREMGINWIEDDMYFANCFDTTAGTYTVYYHILDYDKDNLLDLYYEEVNYDKIYVINHNDQIVMELDYLGPYSQLYVTTSDEVERGYMNIISYRYINKDIDWTEAEIFDWSTMFFDIDGNLLKSFEGILPNIYQTKADPLLYDGQKYMLSNNEMYYVTFLDDEPIFYIYSFEDNTITEITADEWTEFRDRFN